MLIKLLIDRLQLCLMLYSFSNMTKAVNYTYQSCVTVLFFFFFFIPFWRKKLNNIIKKDRLNQPEIQKKVVVEHPPSTLKVWNINSVSSQTMSNRIQFCYIGSSSNNKLCNVILASLFFTCFGTLATS